MMIEDLQIILEKMQIYRETMPDGTISVLVDKWLENTQNVITELSSLGE